MEMGELPVKFGIIGCSDIAKRMTIPAMIHSANAKLSMIGSRSAEKAKGWAKEFGVDEFGTYDQVLNNENLEAVYISLPPALQAEWSIKAASLGKHVICEKSAVINYKQAVNVVKTAKKNKVRVLEAFMFRFHPQHKKFKELQNDSCGDILTFEGKFGVSLDTFTGFRFDRNLGGGALNDAGCYPLCASRIVFENQPIGVMGTLSIDKTRAVDVQGSFYFIYPKNKSAFGSFGYYNYYQSTYTVWGSKSIMGLKRAYAIKPNTNSIIWIHSDDNYREIEVPWADQSKAMIDEFSQVIKNKINASFNYEDDLLIQAKCMEAIRISSKENRFVKLAEIKD